MLYLILTGLLYKLSVSDKALSKMERVTDAMWIVEVCCPLLVRWKITIENRSHTVYKVWVFTVFSFLTNFTFFSNLHTYVKGVWLCYSLEVIINIWVVFVFPNSNTKAKKNRENVKKYLTASESVWHFFSCICVTQSNIFKVNSHINETLWEIKPERDGCYSSFKPLWALLATQPLQVISSFFSAQLLLILETI